MGIILKKSCLRFFTLSVLFFAAFSTKSQVIDSTLARLALQHQPEKVFIHYDKSSYLPGETVWFKGYIMEGLFPATGSKTFYLDWISDNGEVLAHIVAPVVDGVCNGQFEIPQDYKSNQLHVRGYTRWMLNFDSAFLYSNQLRVLQKATAARPQAAIASIHFFPEGGDLVAGVQNRVAFKATDQWGRPVRVKGVVLDKNVFVDSLRTQHDGMGSFFLTPSESSSCQVKWKDEKGQEQIATLPKPRNAGLALQVANGEKRRTIQVSLSPNAPENLHQLNIIGTMNSAMVFKTGGAVNAGSTLRRVIPIENLPSGVLVITVFDRNWNAVAERVNFVNNNDFQFETGFEVKHWGLNKRSRNEIEITIPDNLAGAQLSMSVTDAGIDTDSSTNIISHLMLSSELKGAIHNPAYYFRSPDLKKETHLDLVMLTHGWRRFKWDELVAGKLPAIKHAKDTGYLTLSGQLFGVPKSQLTGNETIVLFVKEKDSAAKTVLLNVNREGIFRDPEAIFFDTLKVYYQVKSKLFSSSGAKFMTDRMAAPNYTAAAPSFLRFPFSGDTNSRYHVRVGLENLSAQDLQRAKMLETVTVRAKAPVTVEEMEKKYTSGLFRGGDGYNFDLVNDPAAIGRMDIFNYLTGRVAGLQINPSGPSLSWRGGTPALFLDERPVDAELLKSIPIDDVAFIKVLRPPFLGAAGGGSGGAIAVYTKRGDDRRQTSTGGGLASNTIMGYSPIKEFYSPNYSSFDRRHETKDARTTLYWQPYIITTPGKNKVKVTFFNNDVSKAFRVVIQGMSREGLLTYHEEIME